MWNFLAGAALGAGQTIWQNATNQQNAATAWRRNKEMQERAFQQNLYLARQQHDWQTQENELAFNREKEWALNEREYNSPYQQLQRLSAAGINPAVGMSNLQNTVSQPLNMAADAGGSASVSSGSTPMAQAAQLPELTSIINGLKGLQLVDAQVQETQSRTNYYNTLAESVNKDVEKKSLQMPYWSDLGKYDVDYKRYSSQSVYRDILEKTFKYNHLLPLEMRNLYQDLWSKRLTNKFNYESFEERLKEIVNRNANLNAQTSYYGDLSRNIDSQISFRDFYVDQMEKTGASVRKLQFSEEQIKSAQARVLSLQKDAIEAMNKGDYVKAAMYMAMSNFMSQAIGGSLIKLPSPMDFMQNIGTVIGSFARF